MVENQKDHRNQESDNKSLNQESDNKSHQEKTQEGKRTTEVDPNNPKAKSDYEHGSQQGNRQDTGSGSAKNQSSTDC